MPLGLLAGVAAGAGLGFGQSGVNYAFNRRLQKHQHEFQERMSSTAYQRSRKDLEAAGLNPIMAFGAGGRGGPASTPSGGTPSVARGESWATTGKNLRLQNSQARMQRSVEAQEFEKVHTERGRAELMGTENRIKLHDEVRAAAEARLAAQRTAIMERDVPSAQAMKELYEQGWMQRIMQSERLMQVPVNILRGTPRGQIRRGGKR